MFRQVFLATLAVLTPCLVSSASGAAIVVTTTEVWAGAPMHGITPTGSGTAGDHYVYIIGEGMVLTSTGVIEMNDKYVTFDFSSGMAGLDMAAGGYFDMTGNTRRSDPGECKIMLGGNSITGDGDFKSVDSSKDSMDVNITGLGDVTVNMFDLRVSDAFVGTLSVDVAGSVDIGWVDTKDDASGGNDAGDVTIRGADIKVGDIDTRALRTASSNIRSGNVVLQAHDHMGSNTLGNSVNLYGTVNTDSTIGTDGNVTVSGVVVTLESGFSAVTGTGPLDIYAGVIQHGKTAGDLFIDNSGGGYSATHNVPWGPSVTFETAQSSGFETVSPALLSVILTIPQENTVTVEYAVTGGTADGNGADYTLLGDGTLTFDPCETVKTIGIEIVNDGNDEPDETIEVTLISVIDGDVTLGGITQHTYTIIDPKPYVQFNASGSSASEAVSLAHIPVSLSHAWNETVTVDYAVTDGTAVQREDYNLVSGTLHFDPSQTTRNISITILDDPDEEGPETIELILSEPNNAKLGSRNQHIFTIDDDELPAAYTNSLGIKFVLIMPGTFQMGSEDGEWDERPVHQVTIGKPFYLMQTEVTADEYGYFNANYSGSNAATGMSWNDANAFCKWLSALEGRTYRLPTEAEWEYACRAGTTTPYSSGGSPPAAGTPNPWGVVNMHNSPREWVWDWHGEYAYEDQVDPVGPEQGMARVVRGGGLDDSDAYYFRSSNRAGIGPAFGGGQHDIGFRVVLSEMPGTAPQPYEAPFARQGIKENAGLVAEGPNPAVPYFNQRPMIPIPPDNASRGAIDAAGLHPAFRGHNHSPGMEVCPNGDVLMIIYTSYSEYEPGVSLMASRLRFGSARWDMPSYMFDFPGANDHAPMLWNDNGTLYFFWGCPRLDGAGPYPFQWRTSSDSGATWDEVKFPNFVSGIGSHSRQPINTALRQGMDTIYVSSDGSGGESVLWVSEDNGLTWYDPGGRTGGRHTTFVLLDNGDILGMGGKNTNINGYMPKSISDDGGQSWSVSSTPFNWLGGNQRPCVARLASGRLFFCSDYQKSFGCEQAPGISEYGSLVALSDDEGQTWTIKKLTSALPHECMCWDCGNVGTLGYSAARQAANGVIHVITTMNHPCQHFEMNEAWILDAGAPPTLPPDPGTSGTVAGHQEDYPGGATKATWSAKTCDDGRYLLHGTETWYYESGQKQYEVTYYNGNKVGDETYWGPDGVKQWSWYHNQPGGSSVWTQWWPNGLKHIESSWYYGGMVADGPSYFWDMCGQPEAAWSFVGGGLAGGTALPPAQVKDADLVDDGLVDWSDVEVFADNWLMSGPAGYNTADLNCDGEVRFDDFGWLALKWLESVP